jgi:dephospho-CoA kinase
MILIGLTGSIAMGKSTVGAMFAAMGAPVFDADMVVHSFYASKDAQRIGTEFPGVMREGVVDRGRLGEYVLGDDGAMARLEAIVHPVVEAARLSFLRRAAAGRARQAVVDLPLLLETGADRTVDVIAVVSAAAAVQKARALGRPGMTVERFKSILSRQTPDREKRRRAHFVIDTGGALEATREQAFDVLRCTAAMTGRSFSSDA